MNKRVKIGLIFIIVFLILYTFLLSQNNKNTIIIGTKNFTEQEIIGYLLEDIIESETKYKVKVLGGIGETSFLQSAMEFGDLDIYVDYTSTAYQNVLGYSYQGESNQEIYEIVKREYNQKFDFNWISLLGFENSNAILCKDFCREHNITKLSELKKYKDLSIGAPIQFFTRSDGLSLLINNYDVTVKKENQVTLDRGLIYPSLNNDELDLALGYTTDGQLFNSDIIILEDDLNSFAKYDAGIIVSEKSLEKYQGLEQVLKKLNQTITLEQMQELNYQVDIKGDDLDQVTSKWNKTKK